MKWTKESPALAGLYWYRTEPGNGVLMKVDDYQDLQQGIARAFIASPQLPYAWSARPAFSVCNLHGEWAAAHSGANDGPA